MPAQMAFSQPDGEVTITAQQVLLRVPFKLSSHKEPSLDCGDTTTAVMSGAGVAFIAEGANKPIFKFTVTNGVEALNVRDHCQDGTAKNRQPPKYPLTIVWSFHRIGVGSLSFKFIDAKLGKSGEIAAKDADGLAGGAFEFPCKGIERSINGGPWVRVA